MDWSPIINGVAGTVLGAAVLGIVGIYSQMAGVRAWLEGHEKLDQNRQEMILQQLTVLREEVRNGHHA